jgi:hypothetical protein
MPLASGFAELGCFSRRLNRPSRRTSRFAHPDLMLLQTEIKIRGTAWRLGCDGEMSCGRANQQVGECQDVVWGICAFGKRVISPLPHDLTWEPPAHG